MAVGEELTIPFIVGTTQIVGQGPTPELWALYATDGVSAATPSWQDASQAVRTFSTARGRESELDEVDSGTATIVLDNRTRSFDPLANEPINVGNRWWLRSQFDGKTEDIFKGYAERYDQSWPSIVGDAVATVSCSDEFKRLNLELLPTMNPPRDSYADVIQFENPAQYNPLDDSPFTNEWKAIAGNALHSGVIPITQFGIASGAIRGDSTEPIQALEMPSAAWIGHAASEGDPVHIGNLAAVTLELWFQKSATPAANRHIMECPRDGGGFPTFYLDITASGQILAAARNASGTTDVVFAGSLADNTWYHIVATTDGTNLTLYLNGAQVAQSPHTGAFVPSLDPAGAYYRLGDSAASGITMRFDEPALYRYALSSARIAAHYQAGAARGFAGPEQTHNRLHAVLDSIDSDTPRSFQASGRGLQGQFMKGQPALDELKSALAAESQDSMLFVGKDGALRFLQAVHRSDIRYNAARATYGDGAGELPYREIIVDQSDAFLANYITVTREGGLTVTSSDAVSIARFGKRSLSKTGLRFMGDATSQTIADTLLAKYKSPFFRIASFAPNMHDPVTASATLGLEIGDRIRILRRPPGGGLAIDQSPWIQKIEISGQPGQIWNCRLGVSPR